MSIKKILPIMLSLTMLFSSIPVSMVYADETDGVNYDEKDDNQSDWDGYDWGQSDKGFADITPDSKKEEQPEEEHESPFIDPVLPPDTNWLKISSDKLSFGQIMKGEQAVDYQYFNIANDGSKTHEYSFDLVDPDDIWEIDAPSKSDIDSGEKLQFGVHPDTNKPEGKYSGSITVFGTNEYGNMESVSISLSVVIYARAPWVAFVDVSPKNLVLSPGASTKMTANVECGDGATSNVDWSVSGSNGDTRIDSDGTLHIGDREKADTITVTATSQQDRSKSGSVAVSIKKDSYSITTESDPAKGGVTAGDGTFTKGENVTVTASPNNKFTFAGWYENGSRVADSQKYSFTVEGNRNLVARFVQDKVRVEVKRNNKNGGTVSDSKTLEYGDSITLKAKAKDGYEFDGWYEDDGKLSSKSEYKLKNVTRDYVITAVFAKKEYKVKVNASPNEGGKVKGDGKYKKGDTAYLEAIPNPGYKFMGWSNDTMNWGSNPKISIENIRQDYSVLAIFEPEKSVVKNIKLSASAGSGGTISPSGTYELAPNVNISFSITPKNGYAISDVTVDGKSIGAVSSFSLTNMTTDHSVIANFKKQDINADTVNDHLNSDFKDNKHVESKPDKSKDEAESKTDEYLEDEELAYYKGALQMLNYTEDEARAAIEAGDDRELMEAALYNGDLMVSARNEYADNPLETAEESYYEIASVPNIEDVIDSMLDTDTKMALFFGMPVTVNLSISDYDSDISDKEKYDFENAKPDGYKVGKYFDITLLTDINGTTKRVEEITEPMKVVANVPDELRGEEVSILRYHEGKVDVLEDTDNDPDTVTFTTDRFSVYAFATKGADKANVENLTSAGNENLSSVTSEKEVLSQMKDNAAKKNRTKNVIIVAIIVAVALILTGVVVGAVADKKKKKRRRRR